jgi:predicted transposase YdaD
MARVTRTPHDALFRFAFSRPENAAGELRSVLPVPLASRIDWSTLRLADGHYVDEDLASRQSDLLYAAAVDGQEMAIYLLFEHQSSPDRLMPFRLLRYMVRIWERWLADNGDAQALPAVVPVVLSHTEGGWRAATSMKELYALPADLLDATMPHLPSFTFVLDDLTEHTDEELRSRAIEAFGSVALGLLRWSRGGPDLAAHLGAYANALRALWRAPDGREALLAVFRYMALAREPLTMQDLTVKLAAVLGDEAGEVVMSEGQRMIDQWRAEGEVKGRAEGEIKGRAEGRAEALLTFLTVRGLSVSDELRQRILGCQDIGTLDRWIARAATARSAADAVSEA